MFIPEITTRVHVDVDTSEIDAALGVIASSEVLSDIPSLSEELEERKTQINDLKDPLAEAVAEGLQANQEMIISSKHHVNGDMTNSVDIMEDGEDYLVGNTASSVDGFPYPLAIETGSRDHWVEPDTFDALHWTDGGKDMFSKGHMVSGIEADPFVEPSIDDTIHDIDEIASEVIDEVIK